MTSGPEGSGYVEKSVKDRYNMPAPTNTEACARPKDGDFARAYPIGDKAMSGGKIE